MEQVIILLTLSIFSIYVDAQNEKQEHKIMFYNVENLFHPSNDSLTADDDFTPDGLYHWSYKKYYKKINMISKVVLALGKGDPPYIIGIAEIENEQVLKDLCYKTPLKQYSYKYIHHESPDRRGIDVALLYRSDSVTVKRERKIPIVFPFEKNTRNRDILHATMAISNDDSIEVFVNHWTSRYGGYAATVPKRNYYAKILKQETDSILIRNDNAKIVIMGDFNDYPTNESLHNILFARNRNGAEKDVILFNLAFEVYKNEQKGSHKHEDFWGCLDQIIVSKGWFESDSGVHLSETMQIFAPEFLLVPDEKYGGTKNYRTFLGPRYIGGFSDHLPIYFSFAK